MYNLRLWEYGKRLVCLFVDEPAGRSIRAKLPSADRHDVPSASLYLAGKTHTMQGVANSSKEMGIIPRTLSALFLKQKRLKKSRIEISIEYLEIYCDDCFDLLVPPPVGVSTMARGPASVLPSLALVWPAWY